jgi:Mg/Co/Ni transporter MgtE
MNPVNGFALLPEEMRQEILQHMSPDQLRAMALVDHQLRQSVATQVETRLIAVRQRLLQLVDDRIDALRALAYDRLGLWGGQ